MKINITEAAINTYVNLHKGKFGEDFGKYVEQCLYSGLSTNTFTLPSEWNDEEFTKWAEYDLLWMAKEEGNIETIDSEYAEAIFEANLEQFEEGDFI